MSTPDPARARARNRAPRLLVDRISCTGHGICAQLLPGRFALDEWGYPIVHDDHPSADEGDTAIRLCPARALSWSAPDGSR